MPLLPFSPVATGDAATDRNFQAIKRCFDALLAASPVLDEVTMTVTITASKTIFHNLGRIANWEVVRQLGTGGLHEVALATGLSNTNAVQLVPEAAGGVYTLRFT